MASESVTADFIFSVIVVGESVRKRHPFGDDFDIFCSGFFRDIMRGVRVWSAFGSKKVFPNFLLKLLASVLVSSRCWSWSSPTGTTLALYIRISAAMSVG